MSLRQLRRALIVGVDGAIGAALLEHLRAQDWLVAGTTRRPVDSQDLTYWDLSEPARAEALDIEVDTVFVCAAMAGLAECESRPDLAGRIDLESPLALARRLPATARLVFLSSTAVFGCRADWPDETASPQPDTVYGRLKAEAERELAVALGERLTTVRLAKVLSPAMPLLVTWAEALAAGRRVQAFTDLSLAPITLGRVVDTLSSAAEVPGGGIIHLSARHAITYFDLCRRFAAGLGYDSGLVDAIAGLGTALSPCPGLRVGGRGPLGNREQPSPWEAVDEICRSISSRAVD